MQLIFGAQLANTMIVVLLLEPRATHTTLIGESPVTTGLEAVF